MDECVAEILYGVELDFDDIDIHALHEYGSDDPETIVDDFNETLKRLNLPTVRYSVHDGTKPYIMVVESEHSVYNGGCPIGVREN